MSLTLSEQKTRKISALLEGLRAVGLEFDENQLQWLEVGASREGGAGFYFRDRVDLTYDSGKYGFYDREHRQIFSVEECPILVPALWELFKAVQKIKLPIAKGSLRLRVTPRASEEGPEGWLPPPAESGIWLDFANDDVKHLFEEKQTLHELLKLGHVEVGQRRKSLHWDGERFRLKDPEYRPWIATSFFPLGVSEPVLVPLQTLIGGFSQTGVAATRRIAGQIHKYLSAEASSARQTWVEFGCGSGSLTFPLLAHADKVIACDMDEMAVEGLRKTLQDPLAKNLGLDKKIEIRVGDYQMNLSVDFRGVDGILVNPPRSGLKKFLNPLLELPAADRPKKLIYMSCFLESFLVDTQVLKESGYQLKQLALIDQFPHTPHVELLSLWE
jgi:tRNA/tmRNA/rRNA uracil-C5-methylase (TrmA/RlmC/RlmD family)